MMDGYKGKNVLITGGLGMMGSNLAIPLVKAGANVILADARIEPYGSNLYNIDEIKNDVDIQVADIRDTNIINHLVKDKEVIFNFAGQVSHNDSMDNPRLDAEINYLGHMNVLEACRIYNPKAKILFSGSRLQFGPTKYLPVNETHPLNPQTPYAVNKVAAEGYYSYCARQHGMKTTSFRIANPYGPRSQMKHSKYSMINWFLRQAMDGKTLKIYGDGSQIRDYIFIDDLVEAFMLAGATEKTNGQVYNVGSGKGTTFKEMAETIVRVVGSGKTEHVPWASGYVNVETGDYYTDITKIREHTGFCPKVSLEEGIRKTFEFYNENKQHYWEDTK
jgi:nucleoside-diphosphate-sugar epimerase